MDNAFKDEFKALRDEILTTFTRRATMQAVGTTLFVALLSAAVIGKFPELSIFGTFLMIAFWNDDVRWNGDILKIASYIRNVIEPRVYGLQWETVLMLVDENHKKNPSTFSRLRMVISRYPMTIVMGVVLDLMLLLISPTFSPMRVKLNILSLLIAILLSIRIFNRAVDFATVNAKWDSIFCNTKDRIDAVTNRPNKSIQADAAEPRL